MRSFIDEKLSELTTDILDSYQRETSTRRIGVMCLPSRAKIIELIGRIRQLLFPGYFGHKELSQQNIQYHLGNLLVQVGNDLTEQVYNCLSEGCSDNENSARIKRADKIAGEFLAKIPQIRTALSLDVQSFYEGDPAARSIKEIIYCYPGFYAITVYRAAHELLHLGVDLMPRIMSEYAHSITGADIHPAAEIGKNFFIDHATGVVIGETCRIGDRVKIYQGVTLGAKSFPKDERGRVIKGTKRHPTIEDDVTIYPNATILGGETVIGKGCTISGNVYLTESVQPGYLVKPKEPKLQVLPQEAGSGENLRIINDKI